MNRRMAAEVGLETVAILDAGQYQAPSGATVDIEGAVRAAMLGTRSYPPEATVPASERRGRKTRVEVRNETTLAAAQRLFAAGGQPVALNFASAKNPGGGFLGGARAQEESLARSSGLYACLVGNPMYDLHRAVHDPMYSNYAIYSPNVPVIRDDEGALLEQPYTCSFVTAPAVNAGVVLERDGTRGDEILREMGRRVEKVLGIMAAHGHTELILGAWGCGVFRNDPEAIAHLFAEALAGPYKGTFSYVLFAVLDWSANEQTIGPFNRAFVR